MAEDTPVLGPKGYANGIPEEEKFTKPKKGSKDLPSDLQYTIDDKPPWALSIVLGFQHYLTMLGATVTLPLIVAPAMCVGNNDLVARSEIMGTLMFVSGMNTLLQSTIGVRLPIVQGGPYTFLSPIFAILSLPQWKCPQQAPVSAPGNFTNFTMVAFNFTNSTAVSQKFAPPVGMPGHGELWQSRMREIQGAIIASSLFQVVIGFSGIIGVLMKFIGPLAITPTIALVGFSLFDAASAFCSKQWWIALMTIIFILLFSQYLRNVEMPLVSCARGKGMYRTKASIFKLFPVIFGIIMSWIVCAVLTMVDLLPTDPNKNGYYARIDIRSAVLYEASWFRIPYPGQWGLPTISTAAVFGMLAGVLASMIESIGDYYACARLAGAPPPPVHATNRGVFMEGIGCVLAGLWGCGTGSTSYSENIGAIGITKVGSCRVIQMGALCMVILGMLGKFGALFVTIPDPIIGGVFMIMFGMISAVGLSNLQFVDLNSSRNLFVIGFSLFFGLSVPEWIKKNPGAIHTKMIDESRPGGDQGRHVACFVKPTVAFGAGSILVWVGISVNDKTF